MNHSQIVSFLWSVADLIGDSFRRGRYQDVILPLTVLRRIDQVLEPTKERVLETAAEYRGRLDNPDGLLRQASGFAFYNTSLYTFERLLGDHENLATNLRAYIQGFSPNMREVVEKFDFDNSGVGEGEELGEERVEAYKRATDDREFGKRLFDLLFEEFWQRKGESEG